MSEDLKSKLREVAGGKLRYTNTPNSLRLAAADRIEELEAKLANQEVYLKRISLAVYKDRRQETLDLIESALEELKGGKDE